MITCRPAGWGSTLHTLDDTECLQGHRGGRLAPCDAWKRRLLNAIPQVRRRIPRLFRRRLGVSKKSVLLRPRKNRGCGVMVAAPDLGSGGESRGGSSPPIRTPVRS